jgi:hypothetical protein
MRPSSSVAFCFMCCLPASSRSATSVYLPTATDARRWRSVGSISEPLPRTYIRCLPNSKGPHSTAHAHSASTVPCTSSRIVRLANFRKRLQPRTATPSTRLKETMLPSRPIRSHAAAASSSALAVLCLQLPPHGSQTPSRPTITVATASRTQPLAADLGFLRGQPIIATLHRRHRNPIRPPR